MPRKKTTKKIKRTTRKPKKVSTKKKTGREKLIGRVSHYFDKISVAAIRLSAPLVLGDTIRIEGGGRSLIQKVTSMQIEHEPVKKAKKSDEIGLKVKAKVHEGYRVYKMR